jgi:nicotinate-nucleotide adenylyltransferase
MKIGILGGTFNPIHIGHLILAEEAREKLALDKVIFVPTFIPPHKDNVDIAPAAARLRMVRIALAKNSYFSVSDVEIKRNGRSYTIDTIKDFKKKCPGDEFIFVIGSDLMNYLEGWKDITEIAKLVKIIAATRPGYPLEDIATYALGRLLGLSTLPIRAVDISGFEIRKAIHEGKSFRYLVPEAVFEYINNKRIYQCE